MVVEPTHLKNISQIGSFLQIVVKIKNIWHHQLAQWLERLKMMEFTPSSSHLWTKNPSGELNLPSYVTSFRINESWVPPSPKSWQLSKVKFIAIWPLGFPVVFGYRLQKSTRSEFVIWDLYEYHLEHVKFGSTGSGSRRKQQKLMQLESWKNHPPIAKISTCVFFLVKKKTIRFLGEVWWSVSKFKTLWNLLVCNFKFEPFLLGIWRDLEFFSDSPICRNTHLQLLEARLHLHLCPGLNGRFFSSQQVVWRNVPPKEIWVVVTSTNHQINRSSRQTWKSWELRCFSMRKCEPTFIWGKFHCDNATNDGLPAKGSQWQRIFCAVDFFWGGRAV